MLDTDEIFVLSSILARDKPLSAHLRRQLSLIEASVPYRNWAGAITEAVPFAVPPWADLPLLERCKLVRDGKLLAKLNRIDDKIFLTDGVWVDERYRVFPFVDESTALLTYVRQAGLSSAAGWTLDLATGCGVNALALGGKSLAFDINPRALAYATANRALCGASGSDCVFILNDIRDGLPKHLNTDSEEPLLVLANLPFGPAPSQNALPLTSNGGSSGSTLQIAAYRALAQMTRNSNSRMTFRAFLMGLTVGDRSANRWEIVDLAVDQFGRDHVRWHLLKQEHVFRVNGVRRFENPACVEQALPGLASCRLYTPGEVERAAKVSAFRDLAAQHQAQGDPDIAYGIVEIDCTF